MVGLRQGAELLSSKLGLKYAWCFILQQGSD
jgi:hypothetical protein